MASITAGDAEFFGAGIVVARVDRVDVSLRTPAYVSVLRVWPSRAIELLRPVPYQLSAERWQERRSGRVHIDLRAWLPNRRPTVGVSEHYLVVIASERPLNADTVEARLADLRIDIGARQVLVTAEHLAQVLPVLVAGEGGGRWGAWIAAPR